MKSRIFTLLAMVLLAGTVQAQTSNVYEESFDYGASDLGFNGGSVGSWTSISGVLKYDADGGLDHAQMGGETGGAMWLDFTDVKEASDSSPSYSLSNLSEGDVLWYAVIFQYVSGNTNHKLEFESGTVSDLIIDFSASGNVSIAATLNTTLTAYHDTGIDVTSGTYLLLVRCTKGAGESPVDSTIDLWVNPADTSSEEALGTADWTLDSNDGQVKWGRDTDTLTSITAQPSQQGRIDEIRIGTDFATVTGGVQPAPPDGTVVIVK